MDHFEGTDGEIIPVSVSVRGNLVRVNSAVFRLVKTRGDGDCLFHCFDMMDRRDNGVCFYRKMTDTPVEWGDHRSIRIYAEITNRTIYVVIPGLDQSFVEVYRSSSLPASEEFILFMNNHFDFLQRA